MARPPQTVGNMVRSMVVVVIGTVLIVIATLFKGASAPSMEYLPTWKAAQRQLSFAPLAPEKLPDGWRVVSVNATATAWHLGFTTANGHYVGIEQGEDFRSWIKGAKADGQWNGWKRWSSPQWRALSDSRAVLCGDGTFAELELLARSLRG